MAPSQSSDMVPEDTLARRGRQLTRMIDMFWSASDVLTLGKQMHRMSGGEEARLRESPTEKNIRLLPLLDKLNELEPMLIERLCRSGSNAGAAMRDAKTRLNMGQSNGKSEDMRKVREKIEGWRKWSTPLPGPDAKSMRGLSHDDCAYLLSPPTVDWEDDDARTQFVAFDNPPMDPSLWPRFFWPEKKYNADRTSEGLLRGELLVKAARAILFSPGSSSMSLPSTVQASGARGHSSRRRRMIGIAKVYQLTEVSPAFIAYVAVVVRHALTSDEVFSDICAGFNYIELYNQVREYLESPKFKHWTKVLLDWWNKELFSGYNLREAIGPSKYRERGTLSRLEAEAEGEEGEEPVHEPEGSDGPNASES